MSASTFVDTNILIYARDRDAGKNTKPLEAFFVIFGASATAF